jgi:hypothetical protein
VAGGLTLAGQQRDFSLGLLRDRFSDLVGRYLRLYAPCSCGTAAGNRPLTYARGQRTQSGVVSLATSVVRCRRPVPSAFMT